MGHFRQYLIRGRETKAANASQAYDNLAPVISMVPTTNGYTATLVAQANTNPAWFMLLYTNVAAQPVDRLFNGVPVRNGSGTGFVDQLDPNHYWSRCAEFADGSGATGPVSAMYQHA